jgi:hypothetical protein
MDGDMGKKKNQLSTAMTEAEFDNGYWYATELRDFAVRIGIPSASKLRKDELEKAVKHFIRTGQTENLVRRGLVTSDVRDIDKGLKLELPVIHYTSNKETKAFIEREAQKLDPEFKRKSGTRYLLNRWREEQIASGKRITYGDLVRQAIALNQTKRGPLRVEHGRYLNFISDYTAAHKHAPRAEAIKAWEEVKRMDAPKTYASWAKAKRR